MAPEPVRFRLQLFVSGATPRSSLAIANIKAIGESRLHGRYDLEVIDACQQAELLRNQQIVVLPTLIKHLPLPIRRMVGDLSDTDRVLLGLGIELDDPAETDPHHGDPDAKAELADHALREENSELKVRLAESEAMLQAIRTGAVDAIVVDTSAGERFFMLQGADQPYREMVETSGEGAVTVRSDGTILYSNQRFADMLRTDLRTVMGSNLLTYFSGEDAASISAAFQQSATSVPRLKAMLVAADAMQVPVNVAMRAHPICGTNSITLVIADLTKWQQAEDARERAIRALRMMNACADVIMHSTDEAGMLTGVCRAMVAVGGYESARVGPAGEVAAASSCSLARSAGNREDKKNPGSVPAEPTPGSEPAGPRTCPRSAFVVHDGEIRPVRGMPGCLAHDTDDRLSVTVPLISGDEFFGCWVICSNEPGVFDQEELDLLAALANDLAFGLASQRNKSALRESELLFHEVAIGFKIQQMLLLDDPPREIPGLRFAALTVPSQRIDGDFYQFFTHQDESVDIIVADGWARESLPHSWARRQRATSPRLCAS